MEIERSFEEHLLKHRLAPVFINDNLDYAYESGQESIINALRSIRETDEDGNLIWPIGATQKLEELLKMFPVKNGGWCEGCSPDNCTGCGGVNK
jgi:hypothetical protein